MSTIEEALYSRLAADGTLIYSSVEIYPQEIRQGATVPAITYQQISAVHTMAMDGEVPLCAARYQLNCYSDTYEGAKDVAEAVRHCLNGYSGTVSSVVIQGIFLEEEHELFMAAVGAERHKRFCRSLDFMVHFNAPLVDAPAVSGVVVSGSTTMSGTNFGADESGDYLIDFTVAGTWTSQKANVTSWGATEIVVSTALVSGQYVRIGNSDGRVSVAYQYTAP